MIDTKLQLISASVSDRGLSDKRPQNEDSVLEVADRGIFAVADGVGGAQAGEIASQMAVEVLAEAFANKPTGSDAEDVMRHAISRANEAIYQMSSELPQLARMATTLAALHIDGDVATIGHVGDSRVYRLDNKGKFTQETDDHSIVAEEVRAGRMSPEDAANHPSRNIISRALGAEPSVDADVKLLLIEPETTFLLCSDGITRHIQDHELREHLFEIHDPREACSRLKQLCYERGAEDNLTAVIVHIPGERSAADAPSSSEFVFEPDDEDTVASARYPASEAEDSDLLGLESYKVSESNSQHKSEIAIADSEAPVTPEAVSAGESPAEAETAEISASGLSHRGPVATHNPSTETFASHEKSVPSRRKINLFLPLLTLLLGAGIGFGAFYYWQQANPPQPQLVPVLTERSTNPPLTAFEETRRIVDRDPAAYINAKVAEPRDAADFYLLGRAYLLIGKIWDAKREFTEAKSRVNEADAADKKTLAMEIALGMAIANSVSAPGLLEKEIANSPTANLETDASKTNAASNSAP